MATMPFPDRTIARILGLALGHANGRPLEFLRGPAGCAKSVLIAPGHFYWTDDTNMDFRNGVESVSNFGHTHPRSHCMERSAAGGRRIVP
jgi:hypothetical protein